MDNCYYTLKNPVRTELVEKRSVFYGYASPVKTEPEAIDYINKIKKANNDATHNVYAYRLREGNTARFSDDGEPHGTAGLPVLEVLRKEEIVDAVVVVTRYFGGIMLGAGGLVRAYSASAKLAVDKACRAKAVLLAVFTLELDYPDHQRVLYLFENENVDIKDTQYTEKVTIKASVLQSNFKILENKISETTNGRAFADYIHSEYGICDI